ncbi:ABC transporter substrate-binding protein [Clostridium formicaceticum]|uniref:ABC transporter substrate-binding protein n=1 Tax=Clostridium formicaceticum TaxID=1497 RepID=UPI001FA93EFB
MIIILLFIFAGIFVPIVSANDPYTVDITQKLPKPCTEFPLGTDHLGRCMLSRLIYGIRTSLSTAIIATILMLAIGVPLGIVAGYTGGWIDNLIMRLVDIASTFPSGLCALGIVGVLGSSTVNIMLVFVLLWWAPFARIVRSTVIKLKEKEFVLAAVASGSSRVSIILKHIILNVISPIIVLATLRIAAVIMHVAGFSFIGLGSQPLTADWGVMLSDSRQYLTSQPLMLVWPGLAIMLAVFAFNMLGEGVKFSDGTDFNAEAVIFNLKRWVKNPRHASLTSVNVESMEAVDNYTVKIVFENGAYPILTELTYPRPVRFLSPSSITEDPGNPMGTFTKPVGTGQWMLESYEKDQEFTFVPNPYYWGEKPKIDRLKFKVIPDGQARALALQSGEIDILGGDLIGKIPMESLLELKNSGNFEISLVGTMCSHFIAFNQEVEAFQDKNVRLAMNYAINKKSIAEDIFDNIGLEANGLYQNGVPYTTIENNYGFSNDKEKAQKLLEAAGYIDTNGDGIPEKNGKNLEFNFVLTTAEFPERKSLAEFVQSELSSVGIMV